MKQLEHVTFPKQFKHKQSQLKNLCIKFTKLQF